jgi:2-dehydropantoate 2-reductase
MSDQIAVIGAGPVGGILSSHLVHKGHSVTLIDVLQKHMEKIRQDGLRIDGQDYVTTRYDSTYLSIQKAAKDNRQFDLVFICVKATAVKHVVQDLPRICKRDSTIASFQNGLDSEAPLLKAFGPDRTLRGVVNFAGNVVSSGHLVRTFFNPPNHFGAASPSNQNADNRAARVAKILSDANLACEFSDNVLWHVWEKAIRNAALMPVATLTGQNMHQVMNFHPSLQLVKILLQEEIEVGKAAGFDFGPNFFDETLEYFRKAGQHVPSMRGDVLEGRQTEIEFLNHRIALYGEKLGVLCPYNRALADLVLSIDDVVAQKKQAKAQP